MKWNDPEKQLPEHNDLVIIIHRSLNVYSCIFKFIKHETFGELNLFIPIDDMQLFDKSYLKDDIDWYKDEFNYDKCYIDCWLPFPDLPPSDIEYL